MCKYYNPKTNVINWDEVMKIPEIAILETTPQHSWWHEEGNALNHTKMVVEKMIEEISTRQGFFKDPYYRKILVYSALFHDIGKPKTTILGEDGYYHCPEHAMEGSYMLPEIFVKYFEELDIYQMDAIAALVKNHMRPIYAMKSENPEKEILKLANSLWGIDFDALLLLKYCDDQGSIHPESGYNVLLQQASDIFYDKVSYKKGTYVLIEKISTINEAHKESGHPNGINDGYIDSGRLLMPVTLGWGTILSKDFHTSVVTKIIDKNHFQTKNSVYKITEL